MNTFEIQIKRLPKIVSEKDTFISSYGKQFEEVDVKLEKQHKEIADLKIEKLESKHSEMEIVTTKQQKDQKTKNIRTLHGKH